MSYTDHSVQRRLNSKAPSDVESVGGAKQTDVELVGRTKQTVI